MKISKKPQPPKSLFGKIDYSDGTRIDFSGIENLTLAILLRNFIGLALTRNVVECRNLLKGELRCVAPIPNPSPHSIPQN